MIVRGTLFVVFIYYTYAEIDLEFCKIVAVPSLSHAFSERRSTDTFSPLSQELHVMRLPASAVICRCGDPGYL